MSMKIGAAAPSHQWQAGRGRGETHVIEEISREGLERGAGDVGRHEGLCRYDCFIRPKIDTSSNTLSLQCSPQCRWLHSISLTPYSAGLTCERSLVQVLVTRAERISQIGAG